MPSAFVHSKCKLAPRWLGPFTILVRRGNNAYLLDDLPQWMSNIYPVFNIAQLEAWQHPRTPTQGQTDQDLLPKGGKITIWNMKLTKLMYNKEEPPGQSI